MKYWRITLATLCAAWACAPELARWRAEHTLREGRERLAAVLGGGVPQPQWQRELRTALSIGDAATAGLPDDARVALLIATATLALGNGDAAAERIEDAIARGGERPELVVNLGRALYQTGRADDADSAYLRAAWASERAITTLPAALREDLLRRVAQREGDLRDGQSAPPPPLPEH